MTENLQTDPPGINEFILNAAINKEPIFDSYNSLCEIRKNQEIDYVDFERKFYQYYHGNTDLTIERSPANSSPFTFTDLPVDVLEHVVEELSLIERFVLRKVSRGLRSLVDTTEIHCVKIGIEPGNTVSLTVGNTLNLQPISDACCQVQGRLTELDDIFPLTAVDEAMAALFGLPVKSKTVVKPFQKVMVSDASTFLQNPKLKIDRIQIDRSNNNGSPEFAKLLMSLDVQLNVRKICIYWQSGHHFEDGVLLSIIQCLKPGSLEEIHIFDQFKEIAETEQWKMAKKLVWKRFPDDFRMEKMLHFKEITNIDFYFDDENLIKIREILLKSTSLESCCLEYDDYSEYYFDFVDDSVKWDAVKQRINKIMSEDPSYDAETRRLSIPDSRDYFQLEMGQTDCGFSMSIRRCSRNE